MKLKYYLRGLGIGIIVTAVIMGVASGNRKETLSDREIRERAAELGMVEQSGSLAEMAQEEAGETPTTEPKATAAAEPEATASTEPTAEPTATASTEPTAEPTATASTDPTKEPKATASTEPTTEPKATAARESAEAAKTVIIEIKSGDGSYTVCQKLEQKGLIDSASDFDTYLYNNGYDRKLRAGSHEIPADAKPEEIAEILCGNSKKTGINS